MAKKKKVRRNTGLPPGSIIFTGEKKLDRSQINLIQFNKEVLTEISRDKVEGVLSNGGDTVLWLDIRGIHDSQLIESVGKQFNMHPLIMEDIADIQQRPKYEEHNNGIFISLKALEFNEDLIELEAEQISIFFGMNFLISFQEKESDSFKEVRHRLLSSSGRIRQRGSDYLAYALVDNIVDRYYLMFDHLEATMEEAEEQILFQPNEENKKLIYQLKSHTVLIRRYIYPLREAVSRFIKSENPIIDAQSRIYIQDLYDHTIQIIDSIDSLREGVRGIYDLYISELSTRTNAVMKLLTIISTIFIPMTFLAGVYGMNFKHLPELNWQYSYLVFWLVNVILVIILLYFFRKKNWL
jgi:magnesium transporter